MSPWPALDVLKVLYSRDMVSRAGLGMSPSDRKPAEVARALVEQSLPVELIAPEPVSVSDVCRVHDPGYVEGVLLRQRTNGFGSLSPSVARSLLYVSGACYDSALVSLSEGISASLTSGFHHAGPHNGRGFCTFNGLMVAATRLLSESRCERIAIVDCDYHYGNGTQEIIDALDLSASILHVSFGETFRAPAQAQAYLRAVAGLRDRFEAFAPDIIIYQAGADPHIDDPLGGLLTTEQMRVRDRTMFALARELSIPLTWNLAGGYQVESDGSIPRVVALHLDTFDEALRIWLRAPAEERPRDTCAGGG